MGKVQIHLVRFLLLLAAGGFLAATLVRFAPGYGVSEDDLDARLSASTQNALRMSEQRPVSLFAFYFNFGRKLAHGDLGTSVVLQEPIRTLIAERLPETLKSIALGLAVAWCFGLGLARAVRVPLLGAASHLLAGLLLCVPAGVVALVFALVGAPGRLAVGLIVFPKVYRLAQSVLRRAVDAPHVLLARAKGVPPSGILFRHVLRVAAPQLLALFGVSACLAFAACIPVEVLCDLPGIGQLAWKAALGRDLPLLVDLTLLVTVVTVFANSSMDLASSLFDRGAQ